MNYLPVRVSSDEATSGLNGQFTDVVVAEFLSENKCARIALDPVGF